MYIWLLLINVNILFHSAHSLFCFDSGSSLSPGMVVNCSADELCYSEFFSLSSSPKTRHVSEWHVDRFCVHREQCLRRGIGVGRCVDLSKLDPIVQRTFRSKLAQKHAENSSKRLIQSEFCCCQRDFCNRMDLMELTKRFNISAANSSNDIKGQNFIYVFIMCFLFILLEKQ